MHIIRFILILLVFFLSLLNFFPAPFHLMWYMAIAVPEFPWIGMLVALLLIGISLYAKRLKLVSIFLSTASLFIFASPIVRAYNMGRTMDTRLQTAFGIVPGDIKGFQQQKPFSFSMMFTGHGAKKLPYTTYHYALHEGVDLTLNFTRSLVPGIRPCVIVVHGGSWRSGDNSEIAAVNNYYANAGYQVATINYRLAPAFRSPAPQEDLHAAFAWLRSHAAQLEIDTTNFVLTGRSAGAQIVLTMAYTGEEPGVKGVAAFYGPSDMLFSYQNPSNRFVLDSRKVQRDFLGGTPEEKPDRYTFESAIVHVTPRTVPTLLVHGVQDAHVWSVQSQRLGDKLTEQGVRNMVLLFPWGSHGCEFNLNGPSGQLSLYAVERFFYSVTQMNK